MKTKIAKIVALISSVTAMLLANSSLAAAPGAAGTSGIVVAPKEGEIGDEGVLAIRVTFPTPMVEIERIKQPGLPSPVLFEPTVETHWTWVSQTEGKLGIKEDWIFPRILHRAKLRPGLKDLAGQPVNVRDWGAEYMNEDFALRRLQFLNVWSDPDAPDDPDDAPSPDVGEESGDIESRKLADPLVAHPIVRLEFSRDVLAQDVAEAVYFQDRVTREKFPVQVNFEERQVAQAQGWFRVEPVSALPSGRSYLLVVDPLKAPKTGETLPHLRIVQAGTTFPLTVRRIVGLNQPVEGAFVRITVNHTIDSAPENLRLIDIQPAVKNLRFEPNEFTLDIRGDFNPATTYRVTLQAGLKSTAFDLEKDSAWTVRFHPKRPAIILTATEMFQPTSVRPVRHSFLQVNTQRLEWKVARIPREKVAEVQSRLREFAEILEEEKDGETRPARHLVSGEYKYRETESLIDVMGWPIVASDKVDASGDDREMKRQIQWNPETNAPGIYLLEITGKDFKGRAIGNRSIISRTDSVSTLISLGTGSIVRLRDVGSGKPMRGVPLQPIDGEEPSTPRQTDGNGEVYFEKGIGDSGLLVGPPGAESLHLLNLPPFPTGHWVDEPDANDDPVLKCAIVTDRNMYRPGETVKLKGFARTYKAGKLAIPVGSKIDWSVEAIAGITSEPPVYGETVVLPANGAWEGSWRISESALGDYFIKAGDAVQKITVSEFRPPAFSVRTTTETLPDGVVRAQISSMHFHGAPNVNAKVRWKAEWVVENWSNDDEQEEGEAEFDNAGLVLSDLCSQEATDQRLADEILSKAGWDTPRADRGLRISARVEGEATLDANGMATLECKSPFPKNTAYGRAKVYWIVDVTSAAAQTLRGGAVSKVQLVPQILGVRMSQSDLKTLYLEIASLNAEDGRSSGLAAKAEVFRVQMKTVKERLGPNLNRYRNSPTYEKVWEGEVTTPAEQKIKVPAAGYYMVRVAATRQPATPLVSDSEVMVGSESYEVGVLDDSGLACKPDRKEYEVGDTANIAVQSPYGGTAIVTVETDRILFRRVVELQGNAHRIALPVEESFAPNAWVCVNLLKPANAGGAPAERFGACEIKVRPTLRRLKVATSLAAEKTTPGANVVGNIIVSSGGKPVAGADVMIFAVDEAILALGRWKLPDFEDIFFPRRGWNLRTHSALGRLWNPDDPDALSHSQKGFILGDAGMGLGDTIFRKDFKALAFWNGSARADANGQVPFQFKAPDGLTSYRVVAVAQAGVDRFGHGRASVTLAKSLQVEPALPDFLRRGDEVVLRTIIRQDYADTDEIAVKLNLSGAQLLEGAEKVVTAKRHVPLSVSFRARVLEDSTAVKVGLDARSRSQPGKADAQLDTLSVSPSAIIRRETIAKTITATKPFDVPAAMQASLLSARGKCDVLISGSPFLPKLAGMPAMLDAQGSVEKVATRILAGTLLADAIRFLPVEPKVAASIKTKTEEGLRRFASNVLEDGGLPVWPRGGQLSAFATAEAAWAILCAKRSEFNVDEVLCRRAKSWLDQMIEKKIGFDEIPPDIRCLALMARADTWESAGPASADDDPKNRIENFEMLATELFENRRELSDEGRAWLALGMHYFDMLPPQRTQLLRELGTAAGKEATFDPVTFSSSKRTEAIRLFARSEIESTNWSPDVRLRTRQSFERITESSVDLSTQENLWLLLVFNSLTRAELSPEMRKRPLLPKPQLSSANGISVGWLDVPLGQVPALFARPLQPGVTGSCLIRATYESAESEAPPRDPSLSLARVVRNITEPGRTGSLQAPYALGDQILITYQLDADKVHSFLEVEDQLPACFETVNPNHPMVAQYFKLPIEAGVNTLPLSNVELRFARTLLYFDKALPGRNLYSTLARVTAAGTFHWPATQVRPMYDSRFSGTTEALVVHAR